MLSGIRAMTDVIGDDVGHCKGEKDGQAHQGDNDVQGDSIRMGGGNGL